MSHYLTSSAVVWPHELFASLWTHHRASFTKYILGGENGVQRFWEQMPARPQMEHRPNWRELCVPLALHGDGVSVSNIRGKGAKTVDVISWTSLLSSAPSKVSIFLIWFCFHHLSRTAGMFQTWKMFWKQLSKSLWSLWSGVWPDEDMAGNPNPLAGRPLAGGYWAVIYLVKGDLDFMANHFQINNTGSKYPCGLCGCTNLGDGLDRVPWTDCNFPPSWMETCWTDEAPLGL